MNYDDTIEWLEDLLKRKSIHDWSMNRVPMPNGTYEINIYVKPTHSIKFIKLNTIITKKGAKFEEVINSD